MLYFIIHVSMPLIISFRFLFLYTLLSQTYLLSGASEVPTSPLKSTQPSISDPKHPLTLAECEALDLKLAEKARDERRYEEEEEEEETERQPDLKKDDMMARRTGAFQKAGGKVYNRFLPLPSSRKVSRPDDWVMKENKSGSGGPFMERNIKTKRFKVGQRWARMVWGMHRKNCFARGLKAKNVFSVGVIIILLCMFLNIHYLFKHIVARAHYLAW